MAQNDFSLANQGFPSMRADMNSAFQALATNSSGSTEPPTTYAYQWWYDTTSDILKIRNSDNDSWIDFAVFDQDSNEWLNLNKTGINGSAIIPTGTTAQRDGTPSTGFLRFNTTEGAFEGYDGAEWSSIGGGGGISYTRQTSNYTASAGEGIIADTSGGTFIITLPAGPDLGDVVVIADGDDWSTNNLTVARNGSTIEGSADNLTLDVGAIAVSFIYDGTTWQIYTQAGSYTASSSIEGFYPTTVSGASQALDLGSFNFFDAGPLTADTTISFSNVPTEARWTYTFTGGFVLGAGYDIENAFYDSVSFGVSSRPTDIFFKPDGTEMYAVGVLSDSVYQFSLSTAWDLSAGAYDSVTFDVSGQNGGPRGIFFKDDGTKMYMVGSFPDQAAYQYTLSTAWDLSTASYDSVSFSVASQDGAPQGIFFKDDGTKMYMVGSDDDSVYQYTLSSAWNLSTASYDSVSFSVASQDSSPAGIFFKPDGTEMYMVGASGNSVHQYTLSLAWNLSTASYDSVSFSVASQDTDPQGIFFKDDGTKMYIVGDSSNSAHQYTVGTFATMTLPASVQNPPSDSFTDDKVTYEFYTLDGGTNVYLINEEVL